MSHITFVKKILANGELCKKCQEISERMSAEGLLNSVDRIVIADERDADSEGMRLARQYKVEKAPFFLVEDEAGNVEVIDIYFKFKKLMAEHGVGQAQSVAL
ncbi:MAG: hypothetical protein AAF431_04800 [Pseudomonadota bacterium]